MENIDFKVTIGCCDVLFKKLTIYKTTLVLGF